MKTKPLKKLPTLTKTQEWDCDAGCDHIEPKLHENAYLLTWDKDGALIDKKAEYYYTCQHGHILKIWDTEECDNVLLDDRFYKEIELKSDLTLDDINAAIDDLEKYADKYRTLSPELAEMFSSIEASYTLTLKNGDELSIYLEDFKALRDRLNMPEKKYYQCCASCDAGMHEVFFNGTNEYCMHEDCKQ